MACAAWLAKGDEIISMAILNHFDATAEERVAYLKQANALRRSDEVEDAEVVSSDADAEAEEVVAARRYDKSRTLQRNAGGRTVCVDRFKQGLRQAFVIL